MLKTIEYRESGDEGEGFYVKETGDFFAQNTLPNDATDEQLDKQADFYTNTINNIQQEQQNKAQLIVKKERVLT